MKAAFADTFFFVAAVNPRDEHHARVIRFSAQFNRPILTTEWILLEVANALAGSASREGFVELDRALRQDPRVRIVPLSSELQARGVALYAQRRDKAWSLTDCISFLVMADGELSDAISGDHHFEQAGFTALLK